MASCNGCQFVGACYKLRPSNISSDGLFYCIACWNEFGGIPLQYVESPPTSCRSCSTRYGMLWMMNPNNPLSTCTFHCTECWKEYGGVPAKAVGFPWPAGVAASGPPRSVLSNFGLPKRKWSSLTQLASKRKLHLSTMEQLVATSWMRQMARQCLNNLGSIRSMLVCGAHHTREPLMLSFLASCYNGDDIPEKVTTDAMYKALNAMEWPHCHSRGNVRPEDEAYIVAAPVGLINLYLMGEQRHITKTVWTLWSTEFCNRLNVTRGRQRPITKILDFYYLLIVWSTEFYKRLNVTRGRRGTSRIL